MAQAITVYDHIAQNNRKTWLLVLLFPVSLLVLVVLACWLGVFLIGDVNVIEEGVYLLPQKWQSAMNNSFGAALGFSLDFLLPTTVIALIWLAISYFFGSKMMMAFAGARPLERKENMDVYNVVENTAIMAGRPTPKIYIIEDDSLNAFATGANPKNAAVALTRGIINKLSKTELQGVVAHELAHIGNRDIRLNMLIITGLGVFESFGRICLRSTGRGNRKSNSGGMMLFIGLALITFNFVVAPLIQMAVSRQREYAADATGAKILHNPKALADALEKISADSRVEVLDSQKNMAVACIASPFAAASGLSSTHPPIKERIRRLRAM